MSFAGGFRYLLMRKQLTAVAKIRILTQVALNFLSFPSYYFAALSRSLNVLARPIVDGSSGKFFPTM